jgi:hypothetical protein
MTQRQMATEHSDLVPTGHRNRRPSRYFFFAASNSSRSRSISDRSASISD